MATPGFNATYYLEQKLQSLQNNPSTANDWADKTVDDLSAELEAAGLTAETHYEQFGFNESQYDANGDPAGLLTPNSFFNAEEYSAAKAQALIDDGAVIGDVDFGALSLAEASEEFESIWSSVGSGNLYDHYLEYGEAEGINPSNSFDIDAYVAAKAAEADLTVPQLKGTLQDAGLSVLEHYEEYGKDEGFITKAELAVDEADQVGGGETFTLTTSGGEVNGTDGDDTFTAPSETLGVNTVNGEGGNDTLNAVLQADDNNAVVTTNSVEIFNLRDTNGTTLDMTDAAGAEQILSDRSTGNLDLDGVSTDTTVGIKNNDSDYTVDFLSVAGASDSATLALNEAGGGDFTADGVETLNVSVSGDAESTVNIDGDYESVIVTSGSQDLDLDILSTTTTSVDSSAFKGDLRASLLGVDATDGITLTFGNGDDTILADSLVIEVDAEDSVSIDTGAGDDSLAIDTILNDLDGDFDGSINLQGGNGENSLSLAIDDGGANTDLGDLLGLDDVTVAGFGEVTLAVEDNDLTTFEMADFGGTTNFGFLSVRANNNVTANAGELTEAFELSIRTDDGATDDLDVVTIDDIGESSSQDSVEATFVAELNDDGGFTTADSNADAGNLTLNAAADADDVTSVTLTSEFSGVLDADELNDPEVGDLDGESNSVANISAQDADGNETLSTLSVAAAANMATGTINMLAGEADASDAFSLDLSGAGAIDIDTVDTGANVNSITVSNSGSGDRELDLAGNAGDLKATAGDDQSAGEGVTISGDGTGTVTLQGVSGTFDELALTATDAGASVVAEITDNNAAGSDVDAASFAGVGTVLLSGDYTQNGAGDTIDNLADDTDVRLTSSQTANALTLGGRDGGTLNIDAVDGSSITGAQLELRNLESVAIRAEDVNGTADTVDVDGISTDYQVGDDSFIKTLALSADEADTLTVTGGNIDIARPDAVEPDNQSFTLEFAGEGTVDVQTDLDLTNAGDTDPSDGTQQAITDLTVNSVDGGTYTLADAVFGSDADNEAVLNFAGDGDATIEDLTTAAADDDIAIDSTGTGDGTQNEIGEFINTTGDITITGDQDLSIGGDTGVSVGDGDTLDASAFTGDLTADFDRAGTGDETYTVELGSGDDTVVLDADGETGNEGVFTFAFAGDDIGTDSIENFAVDANVTEDDILDFSGIFGASAIDSYDSTAGTDGALLDGDGNVLVDFEDDNTATVATSDEFEGQLTLLGVNGSDLDNANFAETA